MPGLKRSLHSADEEDRKDAAERGVEPRRGEAVGAPERVGVCRSPSMVDGHQVVRVRVNELAYVHWRWS